jgi:large subunit ribosomal protein L29
MSKKTDFVNSLKTMSEADLQARLAEDEIRLKKLKFAHATSPLENPMTIQSVRRDIARLKTELNNKAKAQ